MSKFLKTIVGLALIAITSVVVAQSCPSGQKWVCKQVGKETICSCEYRY